MKLLAIAAAAPMLLSANLPANSTEWSDGIPPVRYQNESAAVVLYVSPDKIGQLCGVAPKETGKVIVACSGTRNGTPITVLPNPCLLADRELFARLACHEAGHVQGWPRLHGD